MKLFKGGVLGMCTVLGACSGEMQNRGNIGGANQNARAPGNQRGGIRVKQGEIAVAPSGSYYVTLKAGKLYVGTQGDDRLKELAAVNTPELLAFRSASAGEGFYAYSVNNGVGRVQSYDRAKDALAWSVPVDGSVRRLDVTQDGNRLIVSGNAVDILRTQDGQQVFHNTPDSVVRDVDVFQGGSRVLITEDTNWKNQDHSGPHTLMTVRNTEDGAEQCHSEAPNCSSDVEVSGDENRAFLAPTLCNKDPVSVMRLSDCKQEETMPGFGPVAVSPDRQTMVAFMDRDARDALAPALPAEVLSSPDRFHLMFIDAASLKFTTRPVGDQLPRYAFTSDGASLLLDFPLDATATVSVMDVKTGTQKNVRGPALHLDSFSVAPDGSRVFVLDKGLFEFSVADQVLKPLFVRLPPQSINITPDSSTLLVTEKADRLIMLLDAQSGKETASQSF